MLRWIVRERCGIALVGKLLQQLKKDTLQNICEDLKEPVSGNKEELIMRIADAM